MDPKELQELQAAYQSMYEAKAESSEKEEEDRKEDDDLAGSPNAKKNGKKKAKRWWDDDGDGKGYEKGEVKKESYTLTNADKAGNTKAWQDRDKKNVKTGEPLYKKADHMKEGTVKKELKALKTAKNTLSDKAAAKADDMAGVGSRKGLPEETLAEKQKDTYDQVAAVIDYDRSKKGTDYATYDSEHGKKKEAKKERDYAAFERKKMKRDAQRSGHPWEHAKGSTREKEGKKSEKHAHIKDDKDWGQSLELHDADGNLVYEVIDVIKAPALAAIGEDLASVKATTYGMPHEKRKAIIDKYKKSEKNRGTDEKQGRDAGALARERLKKEGFSNWRNENLTENGNKGKPGYVNIGMGVWVKKEDAEKKKAQLAKSVRGENIPGFKRGRID